MSTNRKIYPYIFKVQACENSNNVEFIRDHYMPIIRGKGVVKNLCLFNTNDNNKKYKYNV